MKCFVCKEKDAESIFCSLACCRECFGMLTTLEQEASRNQKGLTEYIEEKAQRGQKIEDMVKHIIPYI